MKKHIEDRFDEVNRISNKTYEALKILVDNSIYMQNKKRTLNMHLCPSYFKECATVKMSGARQTGHSTALARIGVEYFNNPLYLSPNIAISQRLMHKVHEIILESNEDIVKTTATTIETKDSVHLFGRFGKSGCGFRGYNFDGVLVDCSFIFSQSEIDKMYEMLSPTLSVNKYPMFIFIQ